MLNAISPGMPEIKKTGALHKEPRYTLLYTFPINRNLNLNAALALVARIVGSHYHNCIDAAVFLRTPPFRFEPNLDDPEIGQLSEQNMLLPYKISKCVYLGTKMDIIM